MVVVPKKLKFEDRKCAICDTSFTTAITNQRGRDKRTCGKRSCQDKLRLQTTYNKECVICNNNYTTVRQNSKFCSEKCRRKRHELTCIICSKKFRADRPEIKLCSIECQNQYKSANIATAYCDYCNSEIRRTANHIFKSKNNFCDSTCSNNYWGYNLFSGKSKYGGDWGTIRKNTLEYYNNKCQRCLKGITLRDCNIHHIVPIQYFSDEQKHIANSIENLIPLCIECHKNVHLENNTWYEENFKSGEFLKI